MLKIKLQRTGRKHEPTFRLLLTDSKNSTKTGKFLEVLGSHDFRKDNTEIKKDRVLYWMKNGVKPTPTVHNLLVTHKIIEDKKINVQPRRKPKEKKSK
jgi:small subunit ribosomal protein S16